MSSTATSDGRYHSTTFMGENLSGFLSRDNVHLGNHMVRDLVFEEWTDATLGVIGGWNYGYDGVLGLAPPSLHRTYSKGLPSLLSALEASGEIDAPSFSLHLPRNAREEGELRFGRTNPDLYQPRSALTLPIVNATNGWFKNQTVVPASRVSFDTPKPLNLTLKADAVALIDLTAPDIILPQDYADNFTAAIGASKEYPGFYFVPCERRAQLPSLTFELGDGAVFTVSALEYTQEVEWSDKSRRCKSTIMGAAEFGFPGDGSIIGLGTSFLRAFYSTFDYGKKQIQFE
ncbi:MAG: Vacuolar protease A [Stictis urceolatum]|nr:Vacuolar protease A [Stictis urceolata]